MHALSLLPRWWLAGRPVRVLKEDGPDGPHGPASQSVDPAPCPGGTESSPTQPWGSPKTDNSTGSQYPTPSEQSVPLEGPNSIFNMVLEGTDDGSVASVDLQSSPSNPDRPSPSPPTGGGDPLGDHPEGMPGWVRVSPLEPQSAGAESFRSLVDQLRPQKQASGLLSAGVPLDQGEQRAPRRAGLPRSPPVPLAGSEVSEATFMKDVGPDVQLLAVSQIPSRDPGVPGTPWGTPLPDAGPNVTAASLQEALTPPPAAPARNRQNFWQRIGSAEVVRKLALQPSLGPLPVPSRVPPQPLAPPLPSPGRSPSIPIPGGAPAPVRHPSSADPGPQGTQSVSSSAPSAALQAGSPVMSGGPSPQSHSPAAAPRRGGRLPNEEIFPVQSFIQMSQSDVHVPQRDVTLSSLQAPSLPVPPGSPIDSANAGEPRMHTRAHARRACPEGGEITVRVCGLSDGRRFVGIAVNQMGSA